MATFTMRTLCALCFAFTVCISNSASAQSENDARMANPTVSAVRTRVIMLSSQEFSDKIQVVMPQVLSSLPGYQMVGYCPDLQIVAISMPTSVANPADAVRRELENRGFTAQVFEKQGDWNAIMAEFSCTRR